MSLTIMTFSQIRDLVSNLGCLDQNDTYLPGYNCLKALESLEEALLNEDVSNRNVRIGIHICEAVTKDLIPIIVQEKDPKVLAVTIRVLVSLSLPVEYLLPLEDAKKSPKTENIRNKLMFYSLAVKKAFLDASATLSLVSMLRESIIKSEKHSVPLSEEECYHLKNCLVLLRNLLHIPEDIKPLKESCLSISDWQSLQKKLIWNIFVQGIDGAFLLMLKSNYRTYWIEPLAFILALLYRNQNPSKIRQVIDTISSASESSDDDESDGSKNSSASLSSEPMKDVNMSDSGYPLSDVSLKDTNKNTQTCENSSIASMDIQAKLQRVQLAEDDEILNPFSVTIPPKNIFAGKVKQRVSPKNIYNCERNNSESSSCSESPLHKKMKSNYTEEDKHKDECNRHDSGLSENMDEKLSDVNFSDKKCLKNLKTHKTRNAQIQLKALESDSSNEGHDKKNTKHRNHPPVGWRSKSPRKNGCNPSICMTSALQATSTSKRKIRYPLWEKRNSVSTLVDFKSPVPSDDEIRNLQKEFTLSFMHCGFSEMVTDLKNLILKEQLEAVDKSLFFWILSYFVQLAANIDLNFEHMRYFY